MRVTNNINNDSHPHCLVESQMKLIQRRAYGFKNFNNYRLRVIAQCG